MSRDNLQSAPDAPPPTKAELAERSRGFAWPPRRAHERHTPANATPALLLPAVVEVSVDSPAAAVSIDELADAPAIHRPHAPGLRGIWESIERVWLDVTAPPLAVRLAEAGIGPDGPESYCGRCGRTAGPHETGADGCRGCRRSRLPWDRMVRLGEYRPPWSRMVHEVKFTRWRRLGHDLGRLLGDGVLGAARDVAHRGSAQGRAGGRSRGGGLAGGLIGGRDLLIVPVPMTPWRRLGRGIDHTLTLARGLSAATGGRVRRVLWREHRPSQLEVAASDRPANVAASIHLRRRTGLAELVVRRGVRAIVVVDDVTTTGATMRAACRAIRGGLRGLPADRRPIVIAAVVARTPEEGGRGRVGEVVQ